MADETHAIAIVEKAMEDDDHTSIIVEKAMEVDDYRDTIVDFAVSNAEHYKKIIDDIIDSGEDEERQQRRDEFFEKVVNKVMADKGHMKTIAGLAMGEDHIDELVKGVMCCPEHVAKITTKALASDEHVLAMHMQHTPSRKRITKSAMANEEHLKSIASECYKCCFTQSSTDQRNNPIMEAVVSRTAREVLKWW